MVDSSVGGKTGINLPEAKNVIGAFWQPSLVWSDLSVLATLPDREFRSGLAEVVKYGVILDHAFFSQLESDATLILARDPVPLAAVIRRSCELKAEVVAADERETTGLRAILNYGHTFGHAIESLTEYGVLLHGEAIAIGMSMAGRLALALGRWTNDAFERQTELLQRFGLPTRLDRVLAPPLQVSDMVSAMMHDKKNTYGRMNLILPDRIGHVETVSDVAMECIEQSIREHL
jgi:3-dehydroquinate synthase